MVMDIVGWQNFAGEFRKQMSFFVRSTRRADDADRLSAVFVADFREFLSDQREGFFPRRRNQLAFLADERLSKAFFVIGKVKVVAAFATKELAVCAALVAVAAATD